MKNNTRKFLSVFAVIGFFLIAIASSDEKKKEGKTEQKSEDKNYSNGEGLITHNTASDWNTEATLRQLGQEVWKFCQEHPDAKKLTLVINDECKDYKGNVSNYESKIIFDEGKIKEFATYKDDDSFNKNCFEFGFEIATGWKPCGKALSE